jgi:hypothetical protein
VTAGEGIRKSSRSFGIEAETSLARRVNSFASREVCAAMRPVWQRLVRFIATDGRVLNGEPIVPSMDYDLGLVTDKDNLKAKVIEGTDVFDTSGGTKVTEEIVGVKKILGPLAPSDVPTIRCIGLNYAKHSRS